MISAKEAREMAQPVYYAKLNREIESFKEEISLEIKYTANMGEFSIKKYEMYCSVEKELRSLGYKVKYYSGRGQRIAFKYWEISW